MNNKELQEIQQQKLSDALEVIKEKGLTWECEIISTAIEAQAKELVGLKEWIGIATKNINQNAVFMEMQAEQNEKLKKELDIQREWDTQRIQMIEQLRSQLNVAVGDLKTWVEDHHKSCDCHTCAITLPSLSRT